MKATQANSPRILTKSPERFLRSSCPCLPYIMGLVRQAFEKQMGSGESA